jgi:hypothetical protein
MSFQWPDPISLIADVISIFGIPTLAVSTLSLYQDVKKAREPQAVSHGCLEFYDANRKVGVNLVPLEEISAIPRAGDIVLLPGMTDRADHWKNYGGGNYKVLSVEFSYLEAQDEVDQPCPALPSKIIAVVSKIESGRD